MMNYFLLIIVPNLHCFVSVLSTFGIVLSVASFLIWMHLKCEARNDEDEKQALIHLNRVVKIFLVSISMLFIICFIPSRSAIIQLQVINCIQELKGVQEIPQKLIDKLNKILEIEDKKN
jgi:heme/copper-type cytochrome/quinol oxidase subunit 2